MTPGGHRDAWGCGQAGDGGGKMSPLSRESRQARAQRCPKASEVLKVTPTLNAGV